jgi:hypothetical protein
VLLGLQQGHHQPLLLQLPQLAAQQQTRHLVPATAVYLALGGQRPAAAALLLPLPRPLEVVRAVWCAACTPASHGLLRGLQHVAHQPLPWLLVHAPPLLLLLLPLLPLLPLVVPALRVSSACGGLVLQHWQPDWALSILAAACCWTHLAT